MSALITPMLGDVFWIGGGTLGLILLIVIIVALVRRWVGAQRRRARAALAKLDRSLRWIEFETIDRQKAW